MGNEKGEWIMRGLSPEDPGCVRSWPQLLELVDRVGFLPLFRNSAPGFSVEEHTAGLYWWTGDPERDPWEWREQLARTGLVAYGKFFGKKAGFVSKAWFPRFANWKRDGYDFDSRWDEGLASARSKRIMDCFGEREEWFSFELKQAAGFGKGGLRNFDGVVTDLQGETYLLIRDFRRRINKKGLPYGWPSSVYATPEALWGYDYVTSAYGETPEASREKIYAGAEQAFPSASGLQLRQNLG